MANPYMQNNKNPISSQHSRNINNINRRELVQCRMFEIVQCSVDFNCKKFADFKCKTQILCRKIVQKKFYSLRNLNKHTGKKKKKKKKDNQHNTSPQVKPKASWLEMSNKMEQPQHA
ncbi:hypothetical protein ACJW30_09G061400 [Castanea mollissima]